MAMITKPKRFQSKENLSLIKSFECFICGKTPTDPDHFRSKGAGGTDELSNLNAFCRGCHIKRHSQGIKTFYNSYREKITAARDKYDLPPLDLSPILE